MTTPANRTPARELGSVLAAPLGLTEGVSLFYALLPDDPCPAVAFIDFPAGQPIFTQDPDHDHRESGVQVIARGVDYESAFSLADWIFKLCRHKVGFEASGQDVSGSGIILVYSSAVPQGEPIPLGYDERGRFTFSLNFTIGRCVKP